MDSLIFVPVDFEDWGCYIMVSGCGEERMRKAAYHLLTELGVGVFAEGVRHVGGWAKFVGLGGFLLGGLVV